MKKTGSQGGFSLIEVIAVLVIMGVVAAVAGMGFGHVAESFVFCRENTEMVQKASLALERISREINSAAHIEKATDNLFSYDRATDNGVLVTQRIKFDNSNKRVLLGEDILVDGLAALPSGTQFFKPLKYDGGAWNHRNDPISELAEIRVTLLLPRGSGDQEPMDFTTTVSVRNNEVANAPLPGVNKS